MRRLSAESASRFVFLALILAFTLIVLVLAQSALWSLGVSLRMKVIMVAMAAGAFYQPRSALLALAVLTPLGQVISHFLGSHMRGAEGLILAFLAGTLLRGWLAGKIKDFPLNGLEIASLVLGLIVAASCVEQIWFQQLQRNFPLPFLRMLGTHVSQGYLSDLNTLTMILRAMLLLEGLALVVCVAHTCRVDPPFASRLVAMLVLGAVAAAIVNIGHVVSEWHTSGSPIGRLFELITKTRWSVYIGDFNAAGSYFAMNCVIALGMVIGRRATLWLIPAILTAVAFWMTGSRTAMVATVLAAMISSAAAFWKRPPNPYRLGSALILFGVIVVAALLYFPRGFFDDTAEYVLKTRWMFLGTTLRMVQWQPLSGVGIGQYPSWSRHFSSPELLEIHPQRENAHNNFAQMAGELGIPGLLVFAWLLGAAFWRWRDAIAANRVVAPLLLGLVVFILTWLGGHPLLVPEVAFPFWIALAIVPGVVPQNYWRMSIFGIAGPALVFALAVSVPLRVETKTEQVDFGHISYGFSRWAERPSGEHFRRMEARGRFFVPSHAGRLTIPVRAPAVSRRNPIQLDLFVNSQFADRIVFTDLDLKKIDLLLPPTKRRYHRIDMQVVKPMIPEEEISQQRPSRRLRVEVGEVSTVWRSPP